MNYKTFKTMYNNIDKVPQEIQNRPDEFFKWQEQYVNKYKTKSDEQDLADKFFNFILFKRTIVLTPITMRGTESEQWGKPEQYENLMEALKAAKKYLTRSDNWYSVILDDCGLDDDPTPKKYGKSICKEEETDELPF